MKKVFKTLFVMFSIILFSLPFLLVGCNSKQTIALDMLYNYTEEGEITSLTELGKQQTTIEIPTKINNTNITRISYLGGTTLKNLIIGGHIEYIAPGALRDNLGLISLTIPFVGNANDIQDELHSGTGKTLGSFFANPSYNGALSGTNYIIPKTLKQINITGNCLLNKSENAFTYLPCVESIKLPKEFTIDRNTYFGFAWSDKLTSIIIDPLNTTYDSRNNCNAVIETETNTLLAGCKNTIIPESVTIIGKSAFSSINLTQITIPNHITTIQDAAYQSVEHLENTTLFIPASVKTIGKRAFAYGNITRVVFENPNGWKYGSSSISSSVLSDPETACTYLTSSHINYDWTNNS